MNELEKYLSDGISKPDLLDNPTDRAYNDGLSTGHKQVLALDLPVKFAEWITDSLWVDITSDLWKETVIGQEENIKTTKELYQYWIENILKLE